MQKPREVTRPYLVLRLLIMRHCIHCWTFHFPRMSTISGPVGPALPQLELSNGCSLQLGHVLPVGHSSTTCLTHQLASCVGTGTPGHTHRPLGPKKTQDQSRLLTHLQPSWDCASEGRPQCQAVCLRDPFSLPNPGRPLPCRPPLMLVSVSLPPAALVQWTQLWVQILALPLTGLKPVSEFSH